MFYVITIGDARSFKGHVFGDDSVVLTHFGDALQFMACPLLLPRVDAIILDYKAEVDLVSFFKEALPQAAIVVSNLTLEGDRANDYFAAGATDILFSHASSSDSKTRLMARLKHQAAAGAI